LKREREKGKKKEKKEKRGSPSINIDLLPEANRSLLLSSRKENKKKGKEKGRGGRGQDWSFNKTKKRRKHIEFLLGMDGGGEKRRGGKKKGGGKREIRTTHAWDTALRPLSTISSLACNRSPGGKGKEKKKGGGI